MNDPATVVHLLRVLRMRRFTMAPEAATQAEIEAAFREDLPPPNLVEREKVLGPKDRPDFLINDRVIVEVKVRNAAKRACLRQLERYAAYPFVTELILVTGVALALPTAIDGKPLFVVSLGRAWL